VIEKLDRGDLFAGKKVAATGTMSLDGSVGDVGGVAQKTVAVERAGATVFLVPPQEYAVAKAHATAALHVVAVNSLSASITALERLGGTLRPPPTA
jgi:PDZ domain-containing protein